MAEANRVSQDWTGIVLAGGASRRMGCDKALLRTSGVTWLDHTIRALRESGCKEVWVSGDRTGYRCVADRTPGLGPLAALQSVLSSLPGERFLVVPVDMPCLTVEALKMLMPALETKAHDAGIFEGYELPLALRKSLPLLDAMDALCDPGTPSSQRSLRTLLQRVDCRKLPCVPALAPFLLNFNHPSELTHFEASLS